MLKTSSVFSYSFHAKRELVNRAGKTWPRFVNHRWGSKAEVFEFLSTQLPAIEDFIRTFRNSDGRRNKTCQALQVQSLWSMLIGTFDYARVLSAIIYCLASPVCLTFSVNTQCAPF